MRTIDWPFRADEALASGALTFRELRRFHQAIYPGVWAPRGVELSANDRARAASLWSRCGGVLAGLSAPTMLGAKWIDAEEQAELIHTNRRPPPLISVHTDILLPGEMQTVRGLPVTTPAAPPSTWVGGWISRRACSASTRLMNATDVKVNAIEAIAEGHPGVRGLRQLRQTLDLVDGGAESPYESLTRLLLVQAGFPRPQTQIPVIDEYGFVIARIDIGWPECLVGVDFEGAHHWTDPKRRTWDVERYALLPEFGWTDVRLTTACSIARRRCS